ncbi:hypothetical protein OOK31_25505 [Streptomyces sp. NBC_00249]|uniref:hypothetical protein n=1 Tax=Streptomyces sp. NBC_00249 TaxID=2975690 RepID=UPI0022566129|nr:hypothetical protein [Streptomyces sp. NBC_00249]MCX5197214.1 hypothetical protein [Streptomyces sp. NBC_00249]
MRTHHTAITLAAAGLLALTACDSDTTATPGPSASWSRGTSTSQPDAPAPSGSSQVAAGAADLERVVRAYSGAYFAGDGPTAYAFLSERCTAKAGDEAVFTTIAEANAKDYGPQEIKTLTVDQLAGDMARVSYTYAVPKLNQSGQPWTREDRAWKYDGC